MRSTSDETLPKGEPAPVEHRIGKKAGDDEEQPTHFLTFISI
ncbi:hypothetical protein [Algoriphagus pacificus]|nr:hypothetical protein [Algoriphagus pacificus]